jgi:hypothetical protein
VVAREWFSKNKDSWVKPHAEKIVARLENHIFPVLGGKGIGNVDAGRAPLPAALPINHSLNKP